MNVLWPNGSRDAPNLGGGFGPREPFWTPGGWTNSFHYGQDQTGFDDICAMADGVVTFAGYNGGYGNFIRLDHGDGIGSGYAHIDTGGFYVGYGARVVMGQRIARMGTTGRSTGKHLHHEVYRNGVEIDPAEFIRSNLAGPASVGSDTVNPSEEDDMRVIYSQHLDRTFLIGDGAITHLMPDVYPALNAVGIPGGRWVNQLGKDDFRKVVEAHGISYEQTRLLEPGWRLYDDGRKVDAGRVPWGDRWA
ncbi:MAG: M23 family metallopeptidase [Microbacterium enclense]